MYSCFIICPIGETGSEIRRNADDLRDLIIRPVLEPLGFDVVRGDHRSEAGQIDIDVIRAVQESDLCVIDVSLPNANVYYEFGRRDETGKPMILLKAKGSADLPVDVATRRYIEYDLDSRRGLIDAHEQLKNFVEPILRNGFESANSGTSLADLAEALKRVERKIDRLSSEAEKPKPAASAPAPAEIPDDADPFDLFRLSMRQRNIPMAEKAMDALSYRMNRHRWLDQVASQVACLGSIKAGDILIADADRFMDEASNFHEKVEYVGSLVTNLLHTDRELANLSLVERLCGALQSASSGEKKDQVQVYNQLNRLYYGIYVSTEDSSWLDRAIDILNRALQAGGDYDYVYYNLAMCERARNSGDDMRRALEHVLRCIELDGEKTDADHLEMACKIMHDLGDSRLDDYFSRLTAANPVKAQLLKTRWRHRRGSNG